MIGKQILNYKITKYIGEGGMAKVYEAVHIKLDTKVAVKILDPVLARSEAIKDRFMNEAKIMATLKHKNITQVIDFDDRENELAIIMELLEGENLSDYIKAKGPLNEEETINIFNQTLDAFAYAHQNGIVHRDVKPSNIFIEKDNNIKILDFGIAKILSGESHLTSTGTQMGTPIYMSPEQIKDAKDIDRRTDIYSLGVVLFYMLNGKPPYDASSSSNFEIQSRIVNENFPLLENKQKFNSLIQKATAKNPNDRFQTCEEFMFELNMAIQPPVKEEKDETIKENKQELKQEDKKENNKTEEKVKPTVSKEKIDKVKNDSQNEIDEVINETNKIIEEQKNQKIEKIDDEGLFDDEKEDNKQVSQKKKKSKLGILILILLLLIASGYILFDFSELKPVTEWQTTFEDYGNQESRAIISDRHNSYITTGYAFNSDNNALDFLVCKFDNNGKLEWDKFYGNDRGNISQAIIEGFDDTYVVAGGIFTNETSGNFWIINIDEDGSLLWENSYGLNELWEEAVSICKYSDGYVAVGSSASFDNDIYIVNIDKYGDLYWKKQFGTDGDETARDIIKAQNGNFIVIGESKNGKIKYGYWLVVNNEGNELYSNFFVDDGNIELRSIVENKDNNFFISGQKDNLAWIAEVNPNGKIINEKTYYISSDCSAKQVLILNNNELAVAINDFSGDETKSFVLKIDYNLNIIWETEPLDNRNTTFGITKDKSSNIILTGIKKRSDNDKYDIIISKIKEKSFFKIGFKKSDKNTYVSKNVTTTVQPISSKIDQNKLIIGEWKFYDFEFLNYDKVADYMGLNQEEVKTYEQELKNNFNFTFTFTKDKKVVSKDNYNEDKMTWKIKDDVLIIDGEKFTINYLNEDELYLVAEGLSLYKFYKID